MPELNHSFITFLIVGFLAQFIDGSLGMGQKVTSTTFLLSLGVPPIFASASVHTAAIFTGAASGAAHYQFGNRNRQLFKKLLIPGMIGGILGAILLSHLPVEIIKPFVAIYLLAMGLRILYKSIGQQAYLFIGGNIRLIGFLGGFFDAIGGGGWGPIVTGTLICNGYKAPVVIGTANMVEFFVSLVQATTFFTILGTLNLTIVGGLIIGGVLAAPIAAWLVRYLPTSKLMVAVGILIIILSLRTLLLTFTG
ncbi:MAG: sulfite exporter TauE/SafE family protein [Chloroflexi bacterium]|nr:MAG: sulfite exporter TauE/SafE family protein [Chloroflexota bacterium]